MTRVALFCPGRGAYTENSRGGLPAADPLVQRAEALRRETGLESLLDLDRAASFSPARHLLPENVSMLIWLKSLLDARAACEQHSVVCVGGNSMGWYTALAAAGALDFEDGFRLAQTMAMLQRSYEAEHGGGQLLYPQVDDDWHHDKVREDAVGAILERHAGSLFRSIDLGGFVVLAGSEAAIRAALRDLPKVRLGRGSFPLRLAQHGPYHTPLLAAVAESAQRELSGLRFRRPSLTLIDGVGRRHTPWSSDPQDLSTYTLGMQITDTYQFTAAVRVALREHAPEALVLTGPGNPLGGICGQILVGERWAGLSDRSALERRTASGPGPILSMGQ